MSARDFSRAVGVPDNNTQNYLEPRFAQPKADYLEKVMLHFESINPTWLLTGKGDPFFSTVDTKTTIAPNAQKIFRSPIIGTNKGTANQQQPTSSTSELATAYALIEQLKSQLQDKERIIKLLEKSV